MPTLLKKSYQLKWSLRVEMGGIKNVHNLVQVVFECPLPNCSFCHFGLKQWDSYIISAVRFLTWCLKLFAVSMSYKKRCFWASTLKYPKGWTKSFSHKIFHLLVGQDVAKKLKSNLKVEKKICRFSRTPAHWCQIRPSWQFSFRPHF